MNRKSIKTIAIALLLGLATVVYAGNAKPDCCVAGASCCTGKVCCTGK